MTRSTLRLLLSKLSPGTLTSMLPDQITRLTFQFDRLRCIPYGVLDTAASTFLLLIAVEAYQAGAIEKALIAAGGNIGMLTAPLVVQVVEKMRLQTSRAAAFISVLGGISFLAAALFSSLSSFVLFCVLGVACTQAIVPLMTQVYQDNYAPRERGKYYSRALVLRVAVSSVFAQLAGMYLTNDILWFRWLLVIFSAAFFVAAYFILRIPSRALTQSGSTHPLRAIGYVLKDRIFTWTLAVWMVMGFANLMMTPMRIEFLANPIYGLNLDAQTIALLTSVIPGLARLVMGPVWGWIFDRANFFVLRMVLNVGFALGIATFFTGSSTVGLVAGAVIFGVAASGGDLAWSLWVTRFAPAKRVADYMSVHTFLTGVRGVVAPIVAYQLLNSLSLGILSWISAGLILIATLMLAPQIRYGHIRS